MYQNSASKNYLEAQMLIGMDYLNGNGISQDYAKALEWFEKSASENYAPAQDSIGCMYNNGHCVDQDHFKAFEWFQKAANQNYHTGQVNLALMYKDGLGVAQDHIKALEWFQKAADQGDDIAKYNIDLLIKEDAETQNANSTQIIVEQPDTVSEDINSNKALLIPLCSFFDDYFRDESKRLPLNAGSGVWFPESMSEEELLKYIDRTEKAQAATGFDVPFALGILNIDTTASQNLQEGIYLHFSDEEDGYVIILKNASNDWDAVVELASAHYDQSNQILYINEYAIKSTDQVARSYAERLSDCINAYLNQNKEIAVEQIEDIYSYVITNALDNIDERIEDIEDKIAMLLENDESIDEEQALLDLIYELSEKISTIEQYKLSTNNNEEFLDLMDDFQKIATEVSSRFVDMNERGVILENEQHIEDLTKNITERIEAL